ncbi:tyrosine phosphatase-like protein, partial [Mycena polygramma]
LTHLFNLDGRSSNPVVLSSAPSTFTRFMSLFPLLSPGLALTIESHLPTFLRQVYSRSMTTYSRVGGMVAIVQTCAIFEVAHTLLGWVRSPLPTTAMQVASRLWIVWWIVPQFDAAYHFSPFFPYRRHAFTSPLYTSAVLAWAITDVIRHSFYAANLLGYEPHLLLYLRYTSLFVLYPVGTGSEAFLGYATLPFPSGIPTFKYFAGWSAAEYVRACLFLL